MSIGMSTLKAALSHFEYESRKHRANLMVYLSNPAAVAEHPDVVGEVVKLTQLITESEDNIETLEGFIENWYQNDENVSSSMRGLDD